MIDRIEKRARSRLLKRTGYVIKLALFDLHIRRQFSLSNDDKVLADTLPRGLN